MDEKTEELRDIFTEVTEGEETVTESQEEGRGSLDRDERSVDERLEEIVAEMRERYGFESDLGDDELLSVVEEFYEGSDDEEIADVVGRDPEAVFAARMDLHLVTEADGEGVDLPTVREIEDDDRLAAEFDLDPEAVRRYRRVAAARDESLAANDRYREEFDSLLADADLRARLAEDVREDGLEDATEGMETDVSF
ncbi:MULTISPECIES: conditioned medium-induced protein 4 [Saliphagus]|uniref:Conditioned medium-induced protein 4 n=1 Tax=Saliphagus infecundisoli TaxID=1849069 RepID=A0ABD5QKQ2_9EURY|nr:MULTISPECIES: conditioned medium-induced protein 4 [Saliphagus]